MRNKLTALFLLLLLAAPASADWKLSQKTKMVGTPTGTILTIYSKGVRQRTESKMEMDAETEAAMKEMGSMAANLIPAMPVTITQCDLKQNLYINESGRQFYIDYHDWTKAPPEKLERRKAGKIVFKGTMTTDSWIEDSGKRQKMFGLDARWLKFTQTMEFSADACHRTPPMKLEMEGWFVFLTLENQSCPIVQQPSSADGCFPRLISKRVASPGQMLTGTTRMFQEGKLISEVETETLELSKATLQQSLFEIPADFFEVDSMSDLMSSRMGVDAAGNTVRFQDGRAADQKRRIAVDYFSGNSSKLDQDSLRRHIASELNSAGHNGTVIGSSADLASGGFANVIGVEIKKLKESGASKVGGLFGKVTGSDALAKAGKSNAEIIVTLYGPDGKTVIARSPANIEVSGSSNDAVKAAIDQVISGLISKIK
ncbi:MAG: hypothetical protein KF685_09410 [Acidobacteria bacterium]|nr:hypothetical protein [Acidobacteriota bacterium]